MSRRKVTPFVQYGNVWTITIFCARQNALPVLHYILHESYTTVTNVFIG